MSQSSGDRPRCLCRGRPVPPAGVCYLKRCERLVHQLTHVLGWGWGVGLLARQAHRRRITGVAEPAASLGLGFRVQKRVDREQELGVPCEVGGVGVLQPKT